MDHDDRCALLSLDEPLAGSGPEARRWLLVEDPGPWGHDGLVDGRLPSGVRTHLIDQVARHDVRYQALRRVTRARSVLRTVVVVNLEAGWAARTELAAEDLVDLDLAVAGQATAPRGWQPLTEPLVAVCTHAKRDACCALWGRPVAASLEAVMPTTVWETSHTGGHRFAACVLTFPDGGVHGRVTDVAAFADAVVARRIPLSTYRGNAGLRKPAQAAEVALRAREELTLPDAVTITDCAIDGDRAVVSATTPSGAHEVVVEQRSLPPRPTSCGGAPKDPCPWIVATIDGHSPQSQVPGGQVPGGQVVDSQDANRRA